MRIHGPAKPPTGDNRKRARRPETTANHNTLAYAIRPCRVLATISKLARARRYRYDMVACATTLRMGSVASDLSRKVSQHQLNVGHAFPRRLSR